MPRNRRTIVSGHSRSFRLNLYYRIEYFARNRIYKCGKRSESGPGSRNRRTKKGPRHGSAKVYAEYEVAEIRALADRIEARGACVLMRDQPAQCADLECAAHLQRCFAGLGATPAQRALAALEPGAVSNNSQGE